MKPGKAILRIIKDPDSRTGVSAGIWIRHVRPVQRGPAGSYKIVDLEFKANFRLDCDGVRIRPTVKVQIVCESTPLQAELITSRKRKERVLKKSPMLK